jgi:hypothetical protein
MKSVFRTPGFRKTAVLCAVITVLGLLLGGCPQPTDDPAATQYTITFNSQGGSAVQPVNGLYPIG